MVGVLTVILKKILRWFYNSKKRKGALVHSMIEPQGERKGKGLGALQVYAHPPGPRELFGQDNKKEINRIAQTWRGVAGEPSSAHLKFWNAALAEKWGELSADEQKVYCSQAQARKLASQKPPTQNLVYQWIILHCLSIINLIHIILQKSGNIKRWIVSVFKKPSWIWSRPNW